MVDIAELTDGIAQCEDTQTGAVLTSLLLDLLGCYEAACIIPETAIGVVCGNESWFIAIDGIEVVGHGHILRVVLCRLEWLGGSRLSGILPCGDGL